MNENGYKIIYLKKKILFPFCTINLVMQDNITTRSLKKDELIVAYPIKNFLNVIFYRNRTATLAKITDLYSDKREIRLQLKGLQRVRLKKISSFINCFTETVKNIPIYDFEELSEKLRKRSQELIFLINTDESDRLINLLNYLIELNQLTDFISNYFILDYRRRSKLFNEIDPAKRGSMLITLLTKLISDIKKRNTERTDEKDNPNG